MEDTFEQEGDPLHHHHHHHHYPEEDHLNKLPWSDSDTTRARETAARVQITSLPKIAWIIAALLLIMTGINFILSAVILGYVV